MLVIYNLSNAHNASAPLIEYVTRAMAEAVLLSPEANSIGAGVLVALVDSSLDGAVAVASIANVVEAVSVTVVAEMVAEVVVLDAAGVSKSSLNESIPDE